MWKDEYFSNSYRALITNKYYHFVFTLLEYYLTIIAQIDLFHNNFNFSIKEEIPSERFYIIFIQKTNELPEYCKLIIIIIIFVFIFIYFLVYTKFSFENKNLFNIILINLFENFLFRYLLIIILHILLAIKGEIGIIMIILSIPIISLIIRNFVYNHLHYFSPHFIIYPYDYYSSINDIFHIVEKICISISLQSSIKPFNEFFYIFSFVLQICNLIFSVYILYFRSFWIMSNIFLNKMRFSIIVVSVVNNLILLFFGHKNYMIYTHIFISINILILLLVLVQVFYNPFSKCYFLTNENIENIYFYYYIIDYLRNDNFLLEEKLREHFIKCQRCNMCKNLNSFLEKKKCYKKVYKIIFSKSNVLEITINEIIHNYLINGKESLKNNSFYLINLLYCYYLNINKKNYVLSLNLKLLFEIINLENKNILENHLLSGEQIALINEFLSKAENGLDIIKLALTEISVKERINHFFISYEKLLELKSKKFKDKLYYNKNEGIINFFKHISICTMIYEEIFNISLSNGGLTLKENQIFLDDLSNKNSLNSNQIILELDLLNFQEKIIYITGELAKYKNKALCQLFPNAFKIQQLLIMKNKIMNAKYISSINKDKDFFQNNNNIDKGKNAEKQYIDLKLLIYEQNENKKVFAIISLWLNLIFPINITKTILLAGFYSVNKNIILTLDKSINENKKEIVLNVDKNIKEKNIGNYSNNEVELIKFKNSDKYYNGKKLLFVNKFYLNPNCYNIYTIFYTDKQFTYKMDNILGNAEKKNNNNIYDIESKKNIYAGVDSATQNYNFMMQMSQASSTFSQMANDNQNFKKRDKGNKKESKKMYMFNYYQIGLLLLAVLILLFQIVIHIVLSNSLKDINDQNSELIWLKNYYAMYSNSLISTLCLVCLDTNPPSQQCESVINFYQTNIFRRPGPPLSIFVFNSNKGICNPLLIVQEQIIQILSNSKDKTLISLLNSEMPIITISQNITQNETKLIANKQKDSFINVLKYMTNGFVVLTSNMGNLNNPIYILNKFDYDGNWTSSEEPFKNVKLQGKLTSYQYQIYYLLLNRQKFLQKLDTITTFLSDNAHKTILSNVSFIKIVIIIIFLSNLFLQFVTYFYIQSYYKILAELFFSIEQKMDLKNNDISIREMFLQKIEKLKIIISLYKQDIYQAIVDLNFIYDNYKKFVEEKNKETAKFLKSQKFFTETNLSSHDKKKKEIKKIISSINVNRLYFSFIFFCAFISLLIFFTLFLIWNSYESIYHRIIYLITSHGALSTDAYKVVNYYQLMLYNSETIDVINNLEGLDSSKGEDLFVKMYTDLEDLYESKKYMKNLKKYNLDNIDEYFDHNCSSFNDMLFQTNEGLLQSPMSAAFKPFFIQVCESENIFQSKNYKNIFSMLFEMTQIGINKIHDRSYEGLIAYIKSNYYVKKMIAIIFGYLYIFEILGSRVQRQSYLKISELIESYLHVGFVIYYIASFIFILIIIFFYIYKFNRNNNNLHEMKKVYKICNNSE